MPPTLQPALRTLLTGLAAGDSLGSTSEFITNRATIATKTQDGSGWPFWQVGGGSLGWSPGAPTDDTDMAMGLVYAHLARPTDAAIFAPHHVAEQFVLWASAGPRDIGLTTSSALGTIRNGTPWHHGGRHTYQRNPKAWANGSLMRNGVIAGMADSYFDGFRASLWHGMMTHYAPLPQVCCAAQTFLCMWLLEREAVTELPYGDWLDEFEELFRQWLDAEDDEAIVGWRRDVQEAEIEDAFFRLHQMERELEHGFDPYTTDISGQQGFCLLTFQIALWALRWSLKTDEESATAQYPLVPKEFDSRLFRKGGPFTLSWVALIGYDSDTYGATAGPLIAAAWSKRGLRYGVPPELRDGLLAPSVYDALVREREAR